MSDYTPITDFSAKDSLASGDPNKIIKGADVDAEFEAIQTAVASKADDNAVVKTTGTQTIAGNKTFSDTPDFTGGIKANGTTGKAGQSLVISADGSDVAWWAPGGHLFGLKMSNAADAAHDVTVAVGEASDDTEAVVMKLTSALTKQFDNTFAEGDAAGGMASGETIPTSGVLNVWLIAKTDGTVDVFGNDHATSGKSPTLPTGFTYKRYIGAWITDSSANIRAGTWDGDRFNLTTPVEDLNGNPTATATAVTLSVPPSTVALFRYSIGGTGDTNTDRVNTNFYTHSTGLENPSTAVDGMHSMSTPVTAVSTYSSADYSVEVNASRQVTVDSFISGGMSLTESLKTYGYVDRRGKDA